MSRQQRVSHKRVLALHQPNFLPWVGFFHKMIHSDVFVLLDGAQVPQGRSYATRTQIKTPKGVQWLTVPREHSGKRTYQEQRVRPVEEWADRLWRTLECYYTAAPYWNYGAFDQWWKEAIHWPKLADVNNVLITWARHMMGIQAKVQVRGVLDVPREELPLYLCELYDCQTYLSGMGAAVYNDPKRFRERGIELVYQDFTCPKYPQRWGKFVPNLSIVDLIFNCGLEARDVLA